MKYIIKRGKDNPHKCSEPCPFLSKGNHLDSDVKIGSGYCQGCEHHKNNNLIESIGKDYDINIHGGSLSWIECDKLKSLF